MHKQSAEIDWKQLAEQRKTVNVQREIEIERLRARLAALEQRVRELADKHEKADAHVPHVIIRQREVANELHALLNPSTSHETKETP